MRLAIFDFDGTILRGNSWHHFFCAELTRRPLRAPLLCTGLLLRRTRLWSGRQLRECAVRALRGMTADELRLLGERFHRQRVMPRLVPAALAEIERRRSAGYAVVLATGAFSFNVAPLARSIHCTLVVATELEFADGRCTGSIAADETLGTHKVTALRHALAHRPEIDWASSCAYTDCVSDAPLLELVGERFFVSTRSALPPGLPEGTQLLRWL